MTSIPELFAQQARRTPDAIAVQHGKKTLTYNALNQRANQLAHYLQKRGVGPDTRVAICLERSIDLIVSILGVLKAGGAYVPLDPAYPVERLNYMLADSGAISLITRLELQYKLSQFSGHQICLELDEAKIMGEDASDPVEGVDPGNLAYVIYTSGSTGQPKGVMVEHRGWVNYTQAARETYQLGAGERVLQFASMSWDTSAEEIFPCLTSGATLVLRTDEMLNSIPRFLQNCAEWMVSVVNLPTAFWHELVTQLAASELTLPLGMRVVIIGGERASWEILLKWRQHAPANIRLFNTYGQTECTAVTTCGELIRSLTDGVVPLGKPVQDVNIRILDERNQPVLKGQTGELFIGGPGLARGYLNQPELTAKKFIQVPASGSESERLFKTGDLVRELEDGSLEYVGRIDQQLKIRGVRIEPGEIENALVKHPAVRLAAVIGQPSGPNPEYLAAYVVLKEQNPTTPAELRAWLRGLLPAYSIPAAIVPIKALPLTPNGKLDWRALPVPDFTQTSSNDEGEALTPTQVEVKRIWQDVLGLKNIGLQDDFFEIGGHSLLATRVVARIRQRFNIDVSLRAMFDAPTIARLSEHIQTSKQIANDLALTRRQLGDPLFTSFAQESLWFLDQLVPGNPTYNISDAVRLHGPLDIPALEKALNILIQRQEALRTHFSSVDGQPVPVISPFLQLSLPVIKAPEAAEDEQIKFIHQFAADEAVKPFNLQMGPLLRVFLVQLNPYSHVLIIITHHIISDGWSIWIFFQELSSIYRYIKTGAALGGAENVLPGLPVQFVDYALWQRRFMQGVELGTHLSYWKEKLDKLTPLHFPLDRPRPEQKAFHGARVPIKFSLEASSALQSFSRNEGATLFMVLLAGLQAALARYTAQTDITLGTVIANRHQPELDNIIGFFVNTLVLRTDLEGNPTFRELLKRVKDTTLGAYAHQAVPFELIVQALNPRRAANRMPLFDVMLFLQNVPPAVVDLPGVQAEFLEIEQRTAEFDFVINLTETADGLIGFCEYDTDMFNPDSMLRFIDHFQNLLENGMLNPEGHLLDLAIITDKERDVLVNGWNQTAHPLPQLQTLAELFEAQVKLSPGNTAAVCRGESISYSALNDRANQLAEHLLVHGVQSETIIGICFERSFELLVSVLAILKAGAAYLPLDPAYPTERLQFMLADSQAAWLMTDESHQKLFADFSGQIFDPGKLPAPEKTTTNPIRNINGESACYMIYTSGSTGRPKGVIGIHKATVNRLVWMWETYPFQAGDICCQKTSLSFVDSVWEIFGPLLAGVALVMLPDEDVKDTRKFVSELGKQHVSRVVLVPSLLRLMLETYPNLDEQLSELRFWVSSGEALPLDLAQEFQRKMPGRVLLNLYGSSEIAADSTFYEVRAGAKRMYIGKPIFNTQAYILDEQLQPAPIGVTGEIYIGGSGLARGYWQRPDFNSERFIPNPFAPEPGARLYKTGDLGRFWPDGNIEYVGRADFQIKIRGFRVELGEIQNIIVEHPNVRQAVVVARDAADGQKLVAYIVTEPGFAVSAIRKFAQERLPDYMVPGAWVSLDEFKLTPSGKIDIRSLPEPEFGRLEAVQPYAAPRSEMELRLVKIWEHLLEYSPIGIDDNFFEIGGHSMLVVRLMTLLERELGKPLSLALIFHAPTIALMAAALRDQGWKPTWSSLVPIRPEGSLPPLFCVHADGGAFFYTRFADYLSPQQPVYGLQARGLDGIEPPFTRVEDMAAHYLAEMRTVQPRGMFMISGFSMGGVVIYEMARQIVAAGDPPPLVFFIDAPSPLYFEEQDTRLISKLSGLSRFSPLAGLQRIQMRARQRTRWLADEALSIINLRMNRPLSPALRIHRIRETNRQISDEYQPQPYGGPITILRASEQIRRLNPDPTLGWDVFVRGKISDYEIPGDHETIFHEPNVQVMAQTLQECIFRALGNTQTPG